MTDDILIRMSKAILATRTPGRSKKVWALAAARAALAAAKYDDTEEGEAISVSTAHGVEIITMIECWDGMIDAHLMAPLNGERGPLIEFAEIGPNTWETDRSALQSRDEALAKIAEALK